MSRNDPSAHERSVARRWWDDVGRHLISRQINPDDTQPKVVAPGAGPGFTTQRLVDPKLPSGILNALPFDQLTGDEQRRVIACFQYAHEREQYPERRHQAGESRYKRLKLNGDGGRLAVPWNQR